MLGVTPPVLTVAADLASIVRVGVLAFGDVHVVEGDARLDAPLAASERAVRAQPPDSGTLVRAMYRRTGLDPTKRRPSSEALLRRVLKGDPIPRINNVVDVCNWCSLEFQLPYGLYDWDRLAGDVQLRLGHEGEAYAGIRKDEVHVGGRMTLVDSRGPFGNPSSDSARTMVTASARRVLMVVFAPAELPRPRLEHVLQVSSARVCEFCDAVEVWRGIV
jgi:DNA/RNA-binding domain of Phe-tRNA-synthetase-like protein